MFKTLLWATDGSQAADRALPYVRSLAAEDQATVLVVHSVEFVAGSRAGRLPVHADEEELQEKIDRQVQQLKGDGINATLKIVGGSGVGPAHTIADVARDAGADLILVGTRGHTPLAELLLGSVTQRLLHIADCPVLAVPLVERGAEVPDPVGVGAQPAG